MIKEKDIKAKELALKAEKHRHDQEQLELKKKAGMLAKRKQAEKEIEEIKKKRIDKQK